MAPIVVIGPYRSGKSFLLNQLLNVTCDKGFGVGHFRETQTKGIWIWGQPIIITNAHDEKGDHCYLYVDTEGFESAGKSNSYDDRIFALAVVMSSLMIYNLPEAVRESDLERLSFSVELSNGIFNSENELNHIKSGNMLWLIQRDFLQGKSVQESIERILRLVDNPKKDDNIEDLNKIRRSIGIISNNSLGYGLRQPHLERTKLCEMTDEYLDETYVNQRNELREIVRNNTGVKMMNGKKMNGSDMADLIVQVIEALNEKEIPTANSIIITFNNQLIDRYIKEFVNKMMKVELPMKEEILIEMKNQLKDDLIMKYNKNKYGSKGEWMKKSEELKKEFEDVLERHFSTIQLNNTVISNELCEKIEDVCEKRIEEEGNRIYIPSKYRFQNIYNICLEEFDTKCIGPAYDQQKKRLEKVFERERIHYLKEYNDNLYMGLIILSLLIIVIFRFIISYKIIEGFGWISFVFLEIYPRIGNNASFDHFYQSNIWNIIINVWEIASEYFLLIIVSMVMIIIIFFVRKFKIHMMMSKKKRRLSYENKDCNV